MQRTTRSVPTQRQMLSVRMPAATDRCNALPVCGMTGAAASLNICGLTAQTTRSAWASAAPASAAAGSTAATVAASPAPARIELPSSSADYLNNPRPAYPGLSKRLGEEGKVVLRVLIEADGSASKAEIRSSSGYDRLDQAALQTVLRWRYLPGKRGGVAEAMWFNVPINFVLE